jgi:hypothetical protein
MRACKSNSKYFELSDGSAFIPVGVNICFPRFLSTESEMLDYYREYLGKFAANGGNFVRIWLGSPFFELEPEKEGEFSEEALNRIKSLVKMGEEFGVRFKFTLEHFRFMNPAFQREMFLGAGSFLKTVYQQDNGGSLSDMNSYFSTETGHDIFLRKLKLLSEHFRDCPSVAVWELWNEVNSVRAPREAWRKWSAQMLLEAQELFPDQLCVQSLGSFSSLDHYANYAWLGGLSGNDFFQAHRYIDLSGEIDVCRGALDLLCTDVIATLREMNPEQPAILAEVGAVEWGHCRPSHLYENDVNGMLLHDILFAPFFSGSAGCGQSWHWEFYINKNNLWWHYRRFVNAIEGINPAVEEYKPYRREGRRLRFFGLESGRFSLLWARDKYNTWQNELEHGVAPESFKGLTLDLEALAGHPVSRAEAYLPWEDRRVELEINDGKLALPEFARSIVLKLFR